MGTFCGSPFFVRAGWPVLFFSLVGQTRQGAAAGGFVPHGCGERDAARCRGGPGPHRVGGPGRVPPSGGRCRAGLGFLWRKPKRKSTRGLRPPGPPGRRRSSLPLVGFWVCDRRGGRGFMTYGGLSTDLVLFRFWCQEIKRLDFLRWTKTNWFSLLAQMLLPYFNLNRTMNIFILSDTNFCQMFHLRIERTMILFCNVRKFLQGFFFKANTCLNFICGHGITSLLFCYYFTLFSLAYPVT